MPLADTAPRLPGRIRQFGLHGFRQIQIQARCNQCQTAADNHVKDTREIAVNQGALKQIVGPGSYRGSHSSYSRV